MSVIQKNIESIASVEATSSATNNSTLGLNEGLLWSSFLQGSESAFVKMYNLYFDELYHYGRQWSADPNLTKDCIQDVFIQLRKKRSKLPQVISTRAYLIRCLRNKLITEITKIQEKGGFNLSDKALKFAVVPSHENVLISKQLIQERKSQVQSAISSLPQRQKEAIYYFYYNGFSYKEIRSIMGFGSVRATRNLVYRALQKIRDSII